jgi:hypothetical protein
MNQERLWNELDQVASRYRRLRYWSALAAAWFVAALIGVVSWWLGRSLGGGWRLAVPPLCLIALTLAGFALWLVAKRAPSRSWIARQIEAAFPELRSCLLAAIEQRPDLPDGRFGYLQSNVIKEALDHARGHAWPEIVPARRITTAIVAQFAAFTLFLGGLLLTAFWAGPAGAAAATADGRERGALGSGFKVVVEPGDAEIERGSSLLVLARVQGQMPAEAFLIYQSADKDAAQLPMPLSLKDPIFGTRIAAVYEPLEYHIALDGFNTPVYHVTVFEYPRLERADARLVYPHYTGMEERLVLDVRTVSVVEGTQVTVICRLNKPVASARLVESASTKPVELVAADGQPNVYQATLLPQKSRRLKLELVDDASRRNVQQAEIAIHVVPNQPPVLKPVFPARDVEVSALEELDVKATAWDDFGLVRAGVAYGLAGQPLVEKVLTENAAARARHDLALSIRLEELDARPDELLAYHFWSEDFGPDGKVRRTQSDMYFAEVRPFEEIYRQGQAPPGGQQSQGPQGQNAQAAEQLAKLQKDIINATWKLIRRETGAKPTKKFAADVGEVAQSQTDAREQAERLAEKLQDAQSLAHLATVLEQMEEAASQLKTAHDEPSTAPLKAALSAEQAAYQALLKLRAREHQVVQQQRGQSAGASASARSEQQRQQLRQLDLTNEENRYETQRAAQSPPERAEDRETRQVLNRLSELARRQHDLNERLKDLQSALTEAKTPEQHDEVRRQLQRLKEEEQQVLRDTDELQSRMGTPENQERMADERQQLEQTRDQVQRASEALEEERVSLAAASGTRAARDFEELRNEFRRRAAGRFNDELQQMRQAARDLERREQDLGKRLKQVTNPDPGEKSLRDGGQREEAEKGIAEQRQRLSSLTEQMRQTIQEAEQTEPLLSERLYDAARNAQNNNLDRTLQAAEQSVRRGLVGDAQKQEQAASRGISQLREGVERAAESVLGDETEALRRARDELRNLAEELNREIARNAPEELRAPSGNNDSQGESREPNAGEQRDERSADGQQTRARQLGDRQSANPQAPGQQNARGEPQQRPADGQPSPNGQDREPGQPGEQGQAGARQPRDGQAGQGRPGTQQQRLPADAGQPGGERQAGQNQSGQPGNRQGARRLGGPASGGTSGPEESAERLAAPIGGGGFLNWSDRLRDVEEMVVDPELRAEAARIRDRARTIRADVKRHSQAPNWGLVRVQVAEPLVELSNRVAEELLRRNSKQAVVPLDRDPVPPRYSEKTRRYYEDLGSGK